MKRVRIVTFGGHNHLLGPRLPSFDAGQVFWNEKDPGSVVPHYVAPSNTASRNELEVTVEVAFCHTTTCGSGMTPDSPSRKAHQADFASALLKLLAPNESTSSLGFEILFAIPLLHIETMITHLCVLW